VIQWPAAVATITDRADGRGHRGRMLEACRPARFFPSQRCSQNCGRAIGPRDALPSFRGPFRVGHRRTHFPVQNTLRYPVWSDVVAFTRAASDASDGRHVLGWCERRGAAVDLVDSLMPVWSFRDKRSRQLLVSHAGDACLRAPAMPNRAAHHGASSGKGARNENEKSRPLTGCGGIVKARRG
jgi:hypothetical protein